jgi:hypothetical protein
LRKEFGNYFELKEKSIGPPKSYLGGHLSLVELDNGVKAWVFSSSQYVRAAVQNVEEFIAKEETKKWKLPNKAENPLCTSYRPELDVTPELRCGWFLCELSLSHPSVDVYAHTCGCGWKPIWFDPSDGRSVTCSTFCMCLDAVNVNPDG